MSYPQTSAPLAFPGNQNQAGAYFPGMNVQQPLGYGVPQNTQFVPQQQYNPFVGVQSAQTKITPEIISKAYAKAAQNGTYWKASEPTKVSGGLKLTGAVKYTRDLPPAQSNDQRFVYFPRFLVAGKVQDIYNVLSTIGQQSFQSGGLAQATNGQFGNQAQNLIPLSPQNIYAESIDPLNPQHAALIGRLYEEAHRRKGTEYAVSLSNWAAIGSVVSKNSRSAINPMQPIVGIPSTDIQQIAKERGLSRGRANQISKFEGAMGAALEGRIIDVYNVTKYESSRDIGARVTKITGGTRNANNRLVIPTITIGNKTVQVPIGFNPSDSQGNIANVYSYIDNIVAQSTIYGNYAGAIKQAFQIALGGNYFGQQQQQFYQQAPQQQQQFQAQPMAQTFTVQPPTVRSPSQPPSPRSASGAQSGRNTPVSGGAATFVAPPLSFTSATTASSPLGQQTSFATLPQATTMSLPPINELPSMNFGSQLPELPRLGTQPIPINAGFNTPSLNLPITL